MNRVVVPILSVASAACVQLASAPEVFAGAQDALIAKHATENGVPEPLVRRVIHIESRGRADVVYRGNYGLMQIRLGTARSLGYSGSPEGLLDPDTNLTYAVKYLADAYRAAGCNADRAVAYYKRGYHGVKGASCAGAGTEIAQVRAAPPRLADTPDVVGQAVDVIKPKVVRTELITRDTAESVHAPRLAKFEPTRMSGMAVLDARPVPLPTPKPAALTAEPQQPALQQVAALETNAPDEVVPLPHVRPALKHAVRARHRAEPRQMHAEKKVEGDSSVSGAVISLLKKITTPDATASRYRAAHQSAADQNF